MCSGRRAGGGGWGWGGMGLKLHSKLEMVKYLYFIKSY